VGELSCPHCGRDFPDAESLERHVAGHERHADDQVTLAAAGAPSTAAPEPYPVSTKRSWPERVISGAGMVWRGFWGLVWTLVVIAVVVGGVLAIFSGGHDSNKINVPANAPGYAMLSSLKANGKIDEFQAVNPDSGWDYQYEINGDSGFKVQFQGTSMLVNYSETDQNVANSITAAARDQGYGTGAAP
jgi:hypothetical protein